MRAPASGRRSHRGRPAAADLHLLPSGARAGRAGRAHACAKSAASRPKRSRRPSSAPRRRWRSASCAPRRRSATPRIPYQVPEPDELPERLDSVLRVIYLVFNEGYSASSGQSLTRVDLSGEAIRLGRLLVELLPEPEAIGLLALMLLQESRRAARTSPVGDLILLNDQDRSLWNREPDRGGVGAGRRDRSPRGASVRTRSRRRSRRCTPTRPAPMRPTGARSSGSTTCCCGSSRRRWSS